MKTKAPSSMKRFAAARPMPVAPPVITAVFPFNLVMLCILCWSCTKLRNCLVEELRRDHDPVAEGCAGERDRFATAELRAVAAFEAHRAVAERGDLEVIAERSFGE